MSISFMLISTIGLLLFPQTKFSRNEKLTMLLFLLYYCSSVLSFFNSENSDEAIRKLILKLPILCFPLVFTAFKYANDSVKSKMMQIFLFAMYLPASVSVYNYFSNKVLFDQLILESKPLPIEFGYGIYHIQFSILLAASVILGVYHLFFFRKQYQVQLSGRIFTATLTLLNFTFLHILSARTGLLSLYIGILILLLAMLKNMPLKYKISGLALAIILPLGMFIFSTSLQNRVKNSIEDIRVVWSGADANDYSFAMRVQAWKNASQVIASHPIIGVGLGDADSMLRDNFGKMNSAITISNRKNPHFQFLESSVQSGIISGLLFLALVISMGGMKLKNNVLLISMTMVFLLSSCFESILERQASVLGFSILLALSMASKRK